jgi:Beta-glucosidase-related glycosidases
VYNHSEKRVGISGYCHDWLVGEVQLWGSSGRGNCESSYGSCPEWYLYGSEWCEVQSGEWRCGGNASCRKNYCGRIAEECSQYPGISVKKVLLFYCWQTEYV